MTDKELRRLSRMELIQLLLDQAKELERVQKELEEAKAALESRKISIRNVGSIAEASLEINKVLEAAQRAADQFLENAKAEYTRQAQEQYDEIMGQSEETKDETENDTEAESDAMLEESQRKAGAYDGDE